MEVYNHKIAHNTKLEGTKMKNAPKYIKDIATKLEQSQNREEMYKEVITVLGTFDRPVTVSEILASGMLDIAKYSNQRIAALLKKGIENDEVVKVIDKKKSLFSIKSEE